MNTILPFVVEVALTGVISAAIIAYLRPFLRKVLVDLCGTEDRAQFWTAFCNLVLIGMPVIFALYYRPEATNLEELFFEIAGKLSGNLAGLLSGLIGVGLMVSFFALVSPKHKYLEAK
jgi:hypothetical protein